MNTSGDKNSGYKNSGNMNSGYRNSGDWNSGYRNSGDKNSGDMNSGNKNSGDMNSGNKNSGDMNSGDKNSGYRNSGNRNSGNMNSGNRNSGNRNSGDWNSGDWNSGYLNSSTSTVTMFNKPTELSFDSDIISDLRNTIYRYQKSLCLWVYEKDMSDKEKEENKTYTTTGGYLKVNDIIRNDVEVTKEDREFFETLPNYCPHILKECTGIDLSDEKKTIVIDGKEIKISVSSFNELKNSLIGG